MRLPNAVKTHFDAENSGDFDVVPSCFAVDAVVVDEGRRHVGHAAITAWRTEAKREHNHHTTPIAVNGSETAPIVTARVSGDFAGSPVELDFHFEMSGDLIARLEIR